MVKASKTKHDRGRLAGRRALDRKRDGELDQRFDDAGAHRLRRSTAGRRLGGRGPRALRQSTSPRPRGAASCFPGASTAHAGGALCGDLIRVSVRVDGRPRRRGRASTPTGCGALTAAGSRGRHAGRGRAAARRRARRHARDRRGARRALARASCTPPTWPPTRCTARWARRPRDAAVAARSRPHARGDERRRRLRRRRAARLALGRDAVAVTLELWRDEENDAEASCCSADAVRLARSVAHRMGMPHLTLDLRAGVPRGRRRPVPGRLRGGGDPEPVRAAATATCGWTRCSTLADRLGARRPRHRPLRAGDRRRAAARRRRPGQGPDLHARRAVAGVARADALPARPS